MRILTALLVILIVSPAAAQKPKATPQRPTKSERQSFEFRGHRFGEYKSASELAARCMKDDEAYGVWFCGSLEDQIGSAGVDILYSYIDNELYSVSWSFKTSDFDALRQAFEAKYGPAAVSTEPWVSKGGLRETNVVLRWTFPGAALTMNRVAGKIDEGSATAIDIKRTTEAHRRSDAAAKAAAKRDM